MISSSSLIESIRGEVIQAEVSGVRVFFFVKDASDLISAEHQLGRFYEPEELEILSEYIPPNAEILEIGCHIGNHTIFFEKVLRAGSVTVFDFNPETIKHFHIHHKLNGLTRINLAFLGLALAGEVERMTYSVPERNSGGTTAWRDASGPIQGVPGDLILGNKTFEFVKIDVEGLEVEVLNGLELTIARCRPIIFVEVGNTNLDRVLGWTRQHDYIVDLAFRRYSANVNLILLPKN